MYNSRTTRPQSLLKSKIQSCAEGTERIVEVNISGRKGYPLDYLHFLGLNVAGPAQAFTVEEKEDGVSTVVYSLGRRSPDGYSGWR